MSRIISRESELECEMLESDTVCKQARSSNCIDKEVNIPTDRQLTTAAGRDDRRTFIRIKCKYIKLFYINRKVAIFHIDRLYNMHL